MSQAKRFTNVGELKTASTVIEVGTRFSNSRMAHNFDVSLSQKTPHLLMLKISHQPLPTQKSSVNKIATC